MLSYAILHYTILYHPVLSYACIILCQATAEEVVLPGLWKGGLPRPHGPLRYIELWASVRIPGSQTTCTVAQFRHSL